MEDLEYELERLYERFKVSTQAKGNVGRYLREIKKEMQELKTRAEEAERKYTLMCEKLIKSLENK